MEKRVVITGMGAITPLGKTQSETWENIKNGKNGISQIKQFDTTDFKVKLAAEIKDYAAEEYFDKREVRRMDKFSQFAIIAAKECIEDSGIDMNKVDKNRFGTIIGSGIGGLATIEREQTTLMSKGPSRVSPLMIPMIISNIAAGNVAIKYGLKGVCSCPITACATGASAIGDAFRMIKHGYAQTIIAGGTEAGITPLGLAGFTNITALSQETDPNKASIPFDKNRNGFVMGEGSALVLLEEYESAIERGAKIYGEIIGYGATCDAGHITAPDPEGACASRAIQEAMLEGGLHASQIGYINAHGTSTPPNDKTETLAIKKALGEYAYKIPVSSTKSMLGHMLGAAGSIEVIICLRAMQDSFVPPTINLTTPDSDCDLDYVPNIGRKAEINYCLSNSLGFGGHNITLLFKKI